jgi:hypothetical protein
MDGNTLLLASRGHQRRGGSSSGREGTLSLWCFPGYPGVLAVGIHGASFSWHGPSLARMIETRLGVLTRAGLPWAPEHARVLRVG